ncbi:ABC transporter ATP-binding protein [Candidatus Bathyarchaeota archaeon]|jgi:branched-chain amino acid transport system ATP-binding protein|nr:ABC transporter ATP-binding protein [Candidatus Bathyarchaeota archaeon]
MQDNLDMPILEMRDCSASYGNIRALENASLLIGSHEVVTLLGANGAGKSTLLNCISGLIPVTTGVMLFQGKPVLGIRPEERVRLGISLVPEEKNLFLSMTVENNILLGAYHRRMKGNAGILEQDRQEMFELFPILMQRRNMPACKLSGGEQQMLAIVRGLMASPTLLLLDEPSLGLAPLVADHVMAILQKLKARQISILLAEQNSWLALRNSDRGYVMETGRIVLEGNASTLMNNERILDAYLGGASMAVSGQGHVVVPLSEGSNGDKVRNLKPSPR